MRFVEPIRGYDYTYSTEIMTSQETVEKSAILLLVTVVSAFQLLFAWNFLLVITVFLLRLFLDLALCVRICKLRKHKFIPVACSRRSMSWGLFVVEIAVWSFGRFPPP